MIRGKKKYIIYAVILLVIIGLSVGFSALQRQLLIDDSIFNVRLQEDTRVSSNTISKTSGSAVSNYEDYNVSKIYGNVTFPSTSSYVLYKVDLTNYGNVKTGLLSITNNVSGVNYSICDSNGSNCTSNPKTSVCNGSNCTLGSTKTIYVKVTSTSAGTKNIDLDLNFQPFHTIGYENFQENTSSFQSEIMENDTYEVTLSSDVEEVSVTGSGIANYNKNNHKLTISGVTGNIVVTAKYLTTDIAETSYSGTDPNNYVSFNGTLFRIITKETIDDGYGNEELRAKIIANTSIGGNKFDESSNDFGVSSLAATLNETYYNSIDESSKELIDTALWTENYSGYVGIINATDYTSNSGWLSYQYTLTPGANNSIMTVTTSGLVESLTTYNRDTYPVVYLNQDVLIVGGSGTSTDPYILEKKGDGLQSNPTLIVGKTMNVTGSSQQLVTVTNKVGTPYYSTSTQLNSTNYSSSGSTTIPSATNVGTYTIYYYIPAGANYKAKSGKVTAKINGLTHIIVYQKGSNVTSIGKTGDSCTTTGSSLTCSVTLPSITPATGYTNPRWTNGTNNYNAGSSFTLNSSNSGTTLIATVTVGTYTVAFNANGGSGGQSANVTATYGQDMPAISTTKPTKVGYTFMGWYDNQTYTDGTKYYTDTGLSARTYNKTTGTTLYAGWKIDEPVTPLITGGGTSVYGNTRTLTCSTSSTYASGATKYYSFGYSLTTSGDPSNWTTASTTATYNAPATYETRYYGCRVYVQDSTQTSTTVTSSSSDKQEVTYVNARIDFDATTNGGTLSGTTPVYVQYNNASGYTTRTATTSRAIPTASKTGFTFNGWYTAATNGTKVINANGTIVASVSNWTNSSSKFVITNTSDTANTNRLYAQFSANAYTVSFNVNGGSGTGYQTSDVSATYGQNMPTISTTAPTRTGYTFMGWYDNQTYTSGTQYYKADGTSAKTYDKTSGTILYAGWKANTYTVSFNRNGGSGGQSADVTATYGSAMPEINTTAPTRTGYTFMGWYDNQTYTSGTQYYTASGASARTYNKTSGTTLYAGWSINNPATPTISGGGTNVYGNTRTLTCATTTNYASGTTKYYSFGYSTSDGGTPSNWTTASNSATYDAPATYSTRYYSCRVYASDGTNTTTTITSSSASDAQVTYVNARIDFDATTNGGTISGTTPRYVQYNSDILRTTSNSTSYSTEKTLATKTGYTFKGWYTSATNGTKVINADGTIVASVSNWTNSSNKFILTNSSDTANTNRLYAQFTINNPTTPTISGGGTNVYGNARTLTCATTSTYASGNSIYYSFGYATSDGGTPSNWTTASTTSTYNAPSSYTTRYYSCRVYASDGTNTSETVASATNADQQVTYVNARIDFDATTNGGSISGTSPLYVPYNATNIYTTRSNTTTGTAPTATKSGFTFAGWYTSASGGTLVINSSGVVQASVSGWTDANKKWLLTGSSNTANTHKLYAQFTINAPATPTISNGGTNVYGDLRQLTCSTSTTYASGTTKYYSFGYATTDGGSPSNWTTASDSATYDAPATYYTRYYSCRVYASDGTLTSGTATSATNADQAVTYVNARINFNANGGSLSGSTPVYVQYNNASTYSSRTSTTARTIPTATKSGYTFAGWYTAASGGTKVINSDGTLVASVSNWTNSSSKFILTSTSNTTTVNLLYAQYTINDPATPTISGGGTNVYGSARTLTCATSTTYASGVTKYYSFGYATTDGGTPSNWTTASTTATYDAPSNYTTRYYSCRVYASDGTLTSGTVVSLTTADQAVTYVNARIDFDATTNSGTISGTTPRYVPYNATNIYTGRTNTTAGTVPTATRSGYTFKGWYTASTNGNQVINSSGVVQASVSGWTDANKKWLLTNSSDTANTNRLYAQFEANTYTVSFNANGGSGGQSADVTATYGSAMPTISTTAPTKTGYTFMGWYDNQVYTSGTQYYTAAGASARSYNKTSNTTLYAGWKINDPATPTISGGGTNVYGSARTLTCSTTTNYASGATKYYSFGYSTTDGGTPSNWTTASTTATYDAPSNTSTRYYSCKVYAKDSAQTSNTVTSATNADQAVTYVNARIDFDATTNGGSLSGSTPRYARYASSNLYTTRTGTTTSTKPTATKTGYTFAGWYDSVTGGNQVINASGTLQASVSGWTNSSSQFILTNTSDTSGTNKLYAQFTINAPGTPTISGGGTNVYGNARTLTCSTSTTYASGVDKYYSFGYATSDGGTPSNWTTASTTATYDAPATYTTRYYSCRVYASDATQTSETVASATTADQAVTYVNARINFNVSSNGGTISGTSPVYVQYNNASGYTTRTGTTSRAIPTATKTGYTFAGWYTAASGGNKVINSDGTLVASVSGWTNADSKFILTDTTSNTTVNMLYAQFTINNPATPTISGNGTNVYGNARTLTCSSSTSYASGTTKYYSFGYSTTDGGNPGNWTTASTTATYSAPATYTTRYYSCRVYASDGTLTSGTVASATTSDQVITYVNARINFNVSSNGGTLSGNSPVYVQYNNASTYSTRTSTTARAIPTATKSGYTFSGWYTSASGGNKVINSDGTIVASVSNWTNASSQFILTSTTDTTSSNILYAQFGANTYTVSFNNNGGSGGQSANVQATYNEAMPTISTTAPTKSGYTFMGWYDNQTYTSGTQYYTAAGASARAFNKTSNTTLYAGWKIDAPATPTISGGGTNVYGSARTLTCSTSTTYASGATKYYSFGYSTSDGGSPSNWTTASTTATYDAPSNYTTRYYSCRVYAKDSTQTSSTVTSLATADQEVTYVNARIDFDATTNGGTMSGPTPAYAFYGNSSLFYNRTNSSSLANVSATKTGYTFAGWYTSASGGTKVINSDRSLVASVSGWTNANSKFILTNASDTENTYRLYAQFTINAPGTPTISGGGTNVYGSPRTLTCSSTTTYASGVTKYYSFGYATSDGGTPSNWTTASTTATYDAPATYTLRFYSCRVYASDGTQNSDATASATASDQQVSYVNARIDFDATTNGGSISGTTPLYVPYNATYIYTGRTASSTATIPSATKTGFTFTGWYTAASGGTQVINASGTVQASVSGWTDANKKWLKTSTSDTANTNRLYAQFTINDPATPTISGGGTNVYGNQRTLTCSTSSTYASGTSIYYSFGYSTTDGGTPSTWVSASTSATYNVPNYYSTRYYSCRVYAKEGNTTSSTVASSTTADQAVTYVNARVDFDATTNGGTLDGTSPRYFQYDSDVIRTSYSSSPSIATPTLAKYAGYTFKGWYTAASGGTKVINNDGTLVASVSGWTNANSKFILTNTANIANTNRLYAQFEIQTDFYVSSSGSDNNGTGTVNKPYLTIQKAYSTIVGNSATIYLMTDIDASTVISMSSNKNVTILPYGATSRTVNRNNTSNLPVFSVSAGTVKFGCSNNIETCATESSINVDGLSKNQTSGALINVSGGSTVSFKGTLSNSTTGAISISGTSSNTSTINLDADIKNNTPASSGTFGGSGSAINAQPYSIVNIKGGTIGGSGTPNTASSGNGTVFVGSNATLNMTGGTISYNTALNGGGIYGDILSTINISGGTIDHNTTTGDGGAGIYAHSDLNMTGGTISNNTSSYGGGGVVSQKAFTMTGGTISGNTATQRGGGIMIAAGSFTLNGSSATISSNTVSNGRGGGIQINEEATVTINAGTITQNRANGSADYTGTGGGIAVDTGGTLHFNGGSITYNKANRVGGGIYLYALGDDNQANVYINGGTISYNEALTMSGGGIYTHARLYMCDTYAQTCNNPKIENNTAATYAGGVDVASYGVFTLNAGEINNNEAPTKGGISVETTGEYIVNENDEQTCSGNTNQTELNSKCMFGTDYYVSSTGSDSNAGTVAAPFATIMKAYNQSSTEYQSRIHIMSNLTQTSVANFTSAKDIVISSCTKDGNQCLHDSTHTDIWTITRGSGLTANSVMNNNNASGKLTLTNITFNGNNVGSTYAILLNSGTLNLYSGTTITGGKNTSTASGGVDHLAGTLNLDNALITYNTGDNGGGLRLASTTNIVNSTISHNTAATYGGGFTSSGATINISDSTFEYNSVTNGPGGGFHLGTSAIGTVESTQITNNTANGTASNTGNGGGISVQVKATLNLNSGTISNNTASRYGGGIWLRTDSNGYGTLNMNGGTITNNTATAYYGGGLFIEGTANLNGGTISGNTSSARDAYDIGMGGSTAYKCVDGRIRYTASMTEYAIKAYSNNTFVLDVASNTNNQGQNILLWTANSNGGQKWKILAAKMEDGLVTYWVRSSVSGSPTRYLANTDSGNVVIYDISNDPSTDNHIYSLWRIDNEGTGVYRFTSMLGYPGQEKVLDINATPLQNNRNILTTVYSGTTTNTQKWKIDAPQPAASLSISSSKTTQTTQTCSANGATFSGYGYRFRFTISVTGGSVTGGKMCYAPSNGGTVSSYCRSYSQGSGVSSGDAGYACFVSSTTWDFYRGPYCVHATVNGAGLTRTKYQC